MHSIEKLTEEQFDGREEIEGDLDLGSLTSIPDGFNPTVGGYLDLRSLTSIPDGFNPTVGGGLYLGNGLRAETKDPSGFMSWQEDRFIFIAAMICAGLLFFGCYAWLGWIWMGM